MNNPFIVGSVSLPIKSCLKSRNYVLHLALHCLLDIYLWRLCLSDCQVRCLINSRNFISQIYYVSCSSNWHWGIPTTMDRICPLQTSSWELILIIAYFRKPYIRKSHRCFPLLAFNKLAFLLYTLDFVRLDKGLSLNCMRPLFDINILGILHTLVTLGWNFDYNFVVDDSHLLAMAPNRFTELTSIPWGCATTASWWDPFFVLIVESRVSMPSLPCFLFHTGGRGSSMAISIKIFILKHKAPHLFFLT